MKKIRSKKLAILVISFILALGYSAAGTAVAGNSGVSVNDPRIRKVCNELFDALKLGDTDALSRLLEGEMLEKNRALLEQNQGYPEFLRNYYQNATFEVTEIAPDEEGVMVGFSVHFPDGRNETVYLHLATREDLLRKNPKFKPSGKDMKSLVVGDQIKGLEMKEKRIKARDKDTDDGALLRQGGGSLAASPR